MEKFTIGLDLGQAQDYTALSVFERKGANPPHDYECRHLERFELGTRYPAIVERVKELLNTPPLKHQSTLVIDASGVGRPVCDMFQQAGLAYTGVTITGGDATSRDGNMFRVPKRLSLIHI